MAITLIASLTGTIANAATSTLTVPTGVTASHFGVIVCANANTFSTAETFAITGWTSRAANPSVGTNENWTVLTNLGGSVAGNTLTINNSGTTAAGAYWAVWYDTGNHDVALVSTPGGRSGTSQATTPITGVTTTSNNQDVIVISSERSTATGTVISSWTPSAPTQDLFLEDASGTVVSTFIGHFTQATAGATGTYTPTYNTASGNGVGMMLALAPGVITGTAGFSGTGTLARTASTTAISVSAGFTSTGTFAKSAQAVSIADSATLSGSGSLAVTANAVTLTDSAAFGSSGGLSLSGGNAQADSIALTGEGTLTAVGSSPTKHYGFQAPIAQRYMPFLPALPVLMNYSPALLLIQGQWVQTEYPSAEQIDAATYYFPGGYELSIDHDAARALVLGGFTVDGWDEVLPTDNTLGIALVGTAIIGSDMIG